MVKLPFWALALAAPALLANAPAQKGTDAAAAAERMQSMVGKDQGGGLSVQSVRAEANTLIIVIAGPEGWSDGISPGDISDALVGGFCSSSPQFFASGTTMRVDASDHDKLVRGPLVSSCPKPQS